ncbi:MAG: aldose 1-epimerase [Solirubrobacterales bacterium]
MIGERAVDGFSALVLGTGEGGGIEMAFVPEVGMVGCSLRHRGEELLGQRGGVRRYVEERGTMGIPVLYPWANRLARKRFSVAGRDVVLDSPSTPVSVDPNGLPIHGLLAAARGWRIDRHEAQGDGAMLAASFDFGAHEQLMAAFPFPHELLFEARLSGTTLTITTSVRASADVAVPIAFGYHPYFTLPGVERPDWEVEIPVTERLLLDAELLPTSDREPVRIGGGRLESRTFDDAYVAPRGGSRFAVCGGARRIEVSFESGYPYAQVYAPADDDVIALEPMTAPTNALVTGGPDLPMVAPGDAYSATFSIVVTDDPG